MQNKWLAKEQPEKISIVVNHANSCQIDPLEMNDILTSKTFQFNTRSPESVLKISVCLNFFQRYILIQLLYFKKNVTLSKFNEISKQTFLETM